MADLDHALDARSRRRVIVAAAAFAVLMVGVLVVAVAFPEIAGGPTKDVPLSGKGTSTDDNTGAAWLRATLGFGLVAVWMVVFVVQLRRARARRSGDRSGGSMHPVA